MANFPRLRVMLDRFPFRRSVRSSLPPPPPPRPASPLSLFDLEPRLRAPPLLRGMWAGLSLLDGGYIPRGGPVKWKAQQGE